MTREELNQTMKRVFINEGVRIDKDLYYVKSKVKTKDELYAIINVAVCKIDDDFSNKDFKELFENLLIAVNSVNEENKLSDKELREQQQEAYTTVLKNMESDFPFRFSTKEGGNWFVHIIRDLDLRLVETEQTGNTTNELFNVFMNKPILRNWLVACEKDFNLLSSGFNAMSCIDSVRSLYIIGSMEKSKLVMIEEVKTFSRKIEDWKLSWIDDSKIDSADETNIPTWSKVRDSFVNSEYSFKQFAAWVWIMFDEDACDNNRQCLWLYGDGFDGKSTIINTLKHIINNDKTKEHGCGSLAATYMDSQFWATSVVDRVLVCVNEVTDSRFLSHSNVHQWLGGDSVSIEAKGKTPYSKVLKARCIIASNPEPIITKSENNEITRIIPIRIAKSHFSIDKLNSNSSIEKNTFKDDLFSERWNFLKYCKKSFDEMYNRELNLIRFTTESLSLQLSDSNVDIAMTDLRNMLDGSNKKFYKKEDIGAFIKWYLSKRQAISGYRLGTDPTMKKLGFHPTKKSIPGSSKALDTGYFVSIDVNDMSSFNNDSKLGYGNNNQDNKMEGYEHKQYETKPKQKSNINFKELT